MSEEHNDDYDEFSGLLNCKAGTARLEQAIAEASHHGVEVGLLWIDFDNFMVFNDRHGHVYGDALLHKFSNLLRAVVGEQGMLARFGGDDFWVILPRTSREVANALAEKIRQQTAPLTIEVEGKTVPFLTITTGLVCYPQHGTDAASLMEAADKAHWVGKQSGKDCVCAMD